MCSYFRKPCMLVYKFLMISQVCFQMLSDLRCSPSCNRGGALATEPFCSPDCFRYKGTLDVMYKVVSQVKIFYLTDGYPFYSTSSQLRAIVTSCHYDSSAA